jgi:hypothetical protein
MKEVRMTKHALRTLALLLAAAAIAAVPVPSRASSGDAIVVTIPFEFAVAGEWLPAGEYTVRRVSQSGSAFQIVRNDGEAAAAVSASGSLQAGRRVAAPRLVFVENEGIHYLEEVWLSGENGKRVVRRGFERNMADADSKSGHVVVLVARAR